jgi:hypothetical protein
MRSSPGGTRTVRAMTIVHAPASGYGPRSRVRGTARQCRDRPDRGYVEPLVVAGSHLEPRLLEV